MSIFLQKYLISLKPQKIEHFLLFSILFYVIGRFLYYNLGTTIGQIFRLIGFVFFIFIILKNRIYQPFSGIPFFLYVLLLVAITSISFYTFFIADSSLIGSSFYERFMNVFTSAYFFPSIMPFILILFREGYKFDVNFLLRFMTVLAVIYLFLSPFALLNMFLFNFDPTLNLDFNDEGGYGDFINNSTFQLSVFETPVIMCYWKKYFPKKQWMLFVMVSIIALFIGLYMARRSRTVLYLAYFVLCYWLYLIYDSRSSKLISILWGCLIVFIGSIFVIIGSDSFLSLLFERGIEDTRSHVEQNFFYSLDLNCLLYGRGWFGVYYDESFEQYRKGLETGYLTLILRGGIFYLIIYVSLLLYSAFRGMFKSRSIFVKSFAAIIFMSVLSLYPFGWPSYDFYFFIVWIGVFICNNDYYLKLTDLQVKIIFCNNTDIIKLWLLKNLIIYVKHQRSKEKLLKIIS